MVSTHEFFPSRPSPPSVPPSSHGIPTSFLLLPFCSHSFLHTPIIYGEELEDDDDRRDSPPSSPPHPSSFYWRVLLVSSPSSSQNAQEGKEEGGKTQIVLLRSLLILNPILSSLIYLCFSPISRGPSESSKSLKIQRTRARTHFFSSDLTPFFSGFNHHS